MEFDRCFAGTWTDEHVDVHDLACGPAGGVVCEGGSELARGEVGEVDVDGKVVGVVVRVFSDRSFEFDVKSSPTAVLIKEAAGVEKASGEPNKNKVGNITMAQVEAIAEEKKEDLNSASVEAACRIIAGQARSMGITVEG